MSDIAFFTVFLIILTIQHAIDDDGDGEDGDGIVVRLNETAGRDTTVQLTLFGTAYTIAMPHHGVKTLLVKDGTVIETNFMEW